MLRFVALSTLATTGCFQPGIDSDEHDAGIQAPGELFGADVGGGSDCTTSSPLVSMRIHVRTTSTGGQYAPRNVGAIWIETSAGQFVKTVERWAGTRARYLTKFNASSSANLVDAVTSATLSNHVTHERVWNLTDRSRCKIAPGDYRVMIEMTDKNGAGPVTSIPFTMDDTALTLMPPDTANFHDLLIELK